MNGQSYFQLISPLMYLAFSLGMLGLYLLERRQLSALLFAVSYFAGAVAFAIDFMRFAYAGDLSYVASDFFYMAVTAFFAVALIHYYTGMIRWRLVSALFTISFVGSVILSIFDATLLDRMVWSTFFGTMLFSYPLLHVYPYCARTIDKVVFGLTALISLQFVARVAVSIWVEGDTLSLDTYSGSLASMLLLFMSSVSAMFMAIALFIMFGISMIERLREVSETDELTGLVNRRGLERALIRCEVALETRPQGHHVLILDLDHFKAVNDTFGHDTGDQVLIRSARILKRAVPALSVAARTGGEEFLVVLYAHDRAATEEFAQGLHDAIRAKPHPEMLGASITVSIGIAPWTPDRSFNQAARKADQALYVAKSEGRDGISWEPSEPRPQLRVVAN